MDAAEILLYVAGAAVDLVAFGLRDEEHCEAPCGVERLRAEGADLSKPHRFDFFMHFPSEGTARRVFPRLIDQGFEIVAKSPTSDLSSWVVIATREMIPDEVQLARMRALLSELCHAERGEYDGWAASIPK